MRLSATGAAKAVVPVRRRTATEHADLPTGEATVTLTLDMPDGMEDEAVDRIQFYLFRESRRLAEISACAIRDKQVNRLEAARIKAAPADRPHIIVGAGTKDASGVLVVKGSYEVGGKKLTAKQTGGDK